MFIGNVKEIYIMVESDKEGYKIIGVNTDRDNALHLCKFFESEKKNYGKKYNFITLNLVDFTQAAFDPDYDYYIELKKGNE